jgi:hypothetical protein
MAIKTKSVSVEVDGVEYILDVERAITYSALTKVKKYYPGSYYKYANDVWLLVRDSQGKFNLVNLSNGGLYNLWITSKNGYHLNEQEWIELVTDCRSQEIVPINKVTVQAA